MKSAPVGGRLAHTTPSHISYRRLLADLHAHASSSLEDRALPLSATHDSALPRLASRKMATATHYAAAGTRAVSAGSRQAGSRRAPSARHVRAAASSTARSSSALALRRLGASELEVSEACFGCMTFGRQSSEAESHALLDVAVGEAGVNFLDTAEMYPVAPSRETQGRSSEIIGSWLAKRDRSSMVVASKVRRWSADLRTFTHNLAAMSIETALALTMLARSVGCGLCLWAGPVRIVNCRLLGWSPACGGAGYPIERRVLDDTYMHGGCKRAVGSPDQGQRQPCKCARLQRRGVTDSPPLHRWRAGARSSRGGWRCRPRINCLLAYALTMPISESYPMAQLHLQVATEWGRRLALKAGGTP